MLDIAEPYFFGSEGWKLVPGHFAERHGLIVIIALGESIVAIGVGAEAGVDAGVVVAAVLGVLVSAALWWLYFDIVALVAERRLSNAEVGREQNEIARDSFSYLHFPMIAGIVLLALGLKKTLGDVEDPLEARPGGGDARRRRPLPARPRRLPVAEHPPAQRPAAARRRAPAGADPGRRARSPRSATLAIMVAILLALIVYEMVRFAELRARLRGEISAEAPA